MVQLAELDSLPPQQNQALLIKLRYKSDYKIFDIEIEQSLLVQELIDEMRGQLSIPDTQRLMLKQGQNKLEENMSFSSFGFPNEVIIDIIIEDSYQKEILLAIKLPQINKIIKAQLPESTKINELIDWLKFQVNYCDDIQINYNGLTLCKQYSLRYYYIEEGAELIAFLK